MTNMDYPRNILRKNKASATVFVLTILSVASLLGLSFLFMAQTHLRSANTYLSKLQAKYLAEAGINYARAMFEFDKGANSYDSLSDSWRVTFQGDDIDLGHDGSSKSKWFYINDAQGNKVGRFAVLVKDEASKINVNSSYDYNESGLIQGYSTYEISLKNLLNGLGLDGDKLAQDILSHRYGSDGKPGVISTDDNDNGFVLEHDSLDNNANGLIDETNEGVDEPEEFDPNNTYGDDKPFVVIDDLKRVVSLTSNQSQSLVKFVTVLSKDNEVDANGQPRQNINYIKVDNLLKIMLDKSVPDPWQKTVNAIDSVDSDLARSTLYKHYNKLEPQTNRPNGDWKWHNNRFECDAPKGEGEWSWSGINFPDGEYYCFVYGAEGQPVGDVNIDGAIQEHMTNGQAFTKTMSKKVQVEDGEFKISIQNNEEFGKTCYFQYIELIPEDISQSALLTGEFHGVEAVRINEIMVGPKIVRNTFQTVPKGSWHWSNGMFVNSAPNSGPGGEGTWIFENITPNQYYYVKFIGKEGEFVGDVEVNGVAQQQIRDGESLKNTVFVGANQLVVKIQNNLPNKTCYFEGVELSQQPDCEYIELVNLSNNIIDLSSYTVETSGQEAVVGFIPHGTKINPYSYLVLTVDKVDQAQGVGNNGISFMNTWGIQDSVDLDFFKTLDKDFDFLNDEPIQGENYLTLKDPHGSIVDQIEYLSSQVKEYASLERGDPTVETDNNKDGVFDGWYVSGDLSGGTPGKLNNNDGMKKDEFTSYNIEELNVRNYPVSNILDLLRVTQSKNWKSFSSSDIASLADSLTVSGVVLSPSRDNRVIGWEQIFGDNKGFISNLLGEEGVWKWSHIDNGKYFLVVKGEPNEAITVSYRKKDDSWQVMLTGGIPDASGFIHCGLIYVGSEFEDGALDNTFEIKLQNASNSNSAHFYYLVLSPRVEVYGRINVNTAPKEVLMCLPNVDSGIATNIINRRPFVDLGDFFVRSGLLSDVDRLKTISNLITTKSDVFEVTAHGEVLDGDRLIATQEVRSVIER